MKDWWSKVEDIAERFDWTVSGSTNGNDWRFSKFSPEGQDCNIEINADSYEELVEQLWNWCDNYDVSEEAYLWLDNTGHGKNGAPYDMRDVYNDMEWFWEEAIILRDALKNATYL